LSPAPWGEIRIGASADLIRFDADPRTLTPQELARTPVRSTYLGGAAFHSRERAASRAEHPTKRDGDPSCHLRTAPNERARASCDGRSAYPASSSSATYT